MANPHEEVALEVVLAHFRRSQQALASALANETFIGATVAAAERIAAALKAGGKVLLAGNGGSAADAQHIAAEFVGRFIHDRAPLAAIALTTDPSNMTAIGNDYGFEHVFARQISALSRPSDVFVGISTSGRSPNIIGALKTARELGLTTIGLTRHAATPMHALCDVVIGVPSDETALIQQIHITAAHAICHLVERQLFGASAKA
jgi:D-sedoheptulose 7-phosphate isomerase